MHTFGKKDRRKCILDTKEIVQSTYRDTRKYILVIIEAAESTYLVHRKQ